MWARPCRHSPPPRAPEVEVAHSHAPVLVHQQVGALQVAVDDGRGAGVQVQHACRGEGGQQQGRWGGAGSPGWRHLLAALRHAMGASCGRVVHAGQICQHSAQAGGVVCVCVVVGGQGRGRRSQVEHKGGQGVGWGGVGGAPLAASSAMLRRLAQSSCAASSGDDRARLSTSLSDPAAWGAGRKDSAALLTGARCSALGAPACHLCTPRRDELRRGPWEPCRLLPFKAPLVDTLRDSRMPRPTGGRMPPRHPPVPDPPTSRAVLCHNRRRVQADPQVHDD